MICRLCRRKICKPNLSNQTYQTKSTKPNLLNQTYHTRPTKPNLSYQTYQTKSTKPDLPNQTYQTYQSRIKEDIEFSIRKYGFQANCAPANRVYSYFLRLIGPRQIGSQYIGPRQMGPLENVGAANQALANWAPGKLGPQSHKYNNIIRLIHNHHTFGCFQSGVGQDGSLIRLNRGLHV